MLAHIWKVEIKDVKKKLNMKKSNYLKNTLMVLLSAGFFLNCSGGGNDDDNETSKCICTSIGRANGAVVTTATNTLDNTDGLPCSEYESEIETTSINGTVIVTTTCE